MKLEEMQLISKKKTPGLWKANFAWESASGIAKKAGCGPKYLSSIAGDRLSEEEVAALKYVHKDADFIAMAANNMDKLLNILEFIKDHEETPVWIKNTINMEFR